MPDSKIPFKNVPIGMRFFDEYSGEFYIKINDTDGQIDSGDDSEETDIFLPDEMVVI